MPILLEVFERFPLIEVNALDSLFKNTKNKQKIDVDCFATEENLNNFLQNHQILFISPRMAFI
jgi:hypothetical protein